VTADEGRRRAPSSWTVYGLIGSGTRKVVGGRPVPPLRHGRRSRGSARVTVPASIADGAYRLEACANAPRRIRERNERDNCRAAARTLVVDTGPPAPPLIKSGPTEVTSARVATLTFSHAVAGHRDRSRRRTTGRSSQQVRMAASWPQATLSA
jgi:hypothetical protein